MALADAIGMNVKSDMCGGTTSTGTGIRRELPFAALPPKYIGAWPP
eukprot:CAMPEP_0178418906 /NCGR_PEP_ID=MMETSP0689_2-20121128/25331_1 /TAXON_ID=160604 /ORGANISM="Amphidinium massartii, Strain CS-259" /LENGTH=45 /DNA_ID= /DNA_START= /DNA_END= /DNA_ORIENTATION=